MFDIIGKRRYGYILSSVAMIIGAIFILATLIPNGNVGLQFSIAYTGGTVWEIHFEDGTPEPNDVRAVLDDVGLTGEVAITEANDREFVLIRTEALSLQETELAEGSAAAARGSADSSAATAAAALPSTTSGSCRESASVRMSTYSTSLASVMATSPVRPTSSSTARTSLGSGVPSSKWTSQTVPPV